MMFFVYHLQTYSPKNRAWKKVIDYVEKSLVSTKKS